MRQPRRWFCPADGETGDHRGHDRVGGEHGARTGPRGGGLALLDPSDRAFYTGLVVVLLSLVSAFATYLILTGLTPIVPRNEIVLAALLINVLLIVAMIAVIAWQIAGLSKAWRAKIAGARLHVRIVALFSIIAALPAMLLAIAATTTFSRSIDGWFSDRTRAIIDNSLDVANAYLDEHGQVIRTDIVNMARDIDGAFDLVGNDAKELKNLVMAQAGLRDLPVAYVIDQSGQPVIAAFEDTRLPYLPPPSSVIAQAEQGHVPLLMPTNSNRVAAVSKLQKYPGQYLYVARGVDPRSCATCSARSRTSTSTTGCGKRAAASSSRTASCT